LNALQPLAKFRGYFLTNAPIGIPSILFLAVAAITMDPVE
jgi:hypothetical protein